MIFFGESTEKRYGRLSGFHPHEEVFFPRNEWIVRYSTLAGLKKLWKSSQETGQLTIIRETVRVGLVYRGNPCSFVVFGFTVQAISLQ
jgi:hypothetical protein